MNSIPISLFPICISIEMAQKILGTHTVSLDETRGKKRFVDFLYTCVRNRTLKAELENQVYRLLYI